MFEHIADPFIRAAIQSPCQNVDKTALSSILDDCVMSLNEDYDNEDVPFDVFDARSIALLRAQDQYLSGDYGSCHKSLQDFFSI